MRGDIYIYHAMKIIMENHHEVFAYMGMNHQERLAASVIALHRLRTLLSTPERLPMRVGGDLFIELVHIICERKLMSIGRFIEVAEQVGMCFYILLRGTSYREIAERFQHSISTISKYFLEALEALVTLSVDVIRPYYNLHEVPPEISNNGRHRPFFQYIAYLQIISSTQVTIRSVHQIRYLVCIYNYKFVDHK
ncbi:hypothetical protein Cgig2_009719 [Carnegiea gigantea]|uniref:DUF8040 domain-containing protein n=1 Tax=Carnegiea gigantea TaxID=171969 RepID=A0A9Q1K4M9_9CARY|nr:hypothetical protein Cgig2_009719 [Carnegiea gigantea]